jgi:ATP-dependent exoDNAse (exonuclease V) beta subunit
MTGDESNAIIDAVDAVNLMTVHAAKGLEFPVVCVVNLSRGAGGRHGPLEIVTRQAPDGTIADLVSIDGLAEDVEDEIDAREREEAKRLLYVAVTRARDRLYLATALGRDGTFAPAASALGHVLPVSFGAVLARAGVAGTDTVEWRAASGGAHVCRVIGPGVAPVRTDGGGPVAPGVRDDFATLAFAADQRRAASALAFGDPDAALARADVADRTAARDIGALVHRAVAAGALRASPERRVTLVERVAATHEPTTRGQVAAALAAVGRLPEILALMSEEDVQHEVPLSWRADDGTTVRAVVDALVHHADGSVTVVELKTGTPRDSDARQLQLYVEAVERLVPGTPVRGRIVRLDA